MLGAPGAQRVDLADLNFEDALIEKNQGIEGHVLGASRNALLGGEVGEILADGLFAFFHGVAAVLEQDEVHDIAAVGLASRAFEVPQREFLLHSVQPLHHAAAFQYFIIGCTEVISARHGFAIHGYLPYFFRADIPPFPWIVRS